MLKIRRIMEQVHSLTHMGSVGRAHLRLTIIKNSRATDYIFFVY